MIDSMIKYIEEYETLQDKKFLSFAREINGLVGCSSVELLANCVKHIDKDKNCYLEVGTFQGMSLLGTAMNNPEISCYGVENFAEEFRDNWGKIPFCCSNKKILELHMQQFNKAGNAFVFEQDYEEFFRDRNDVNGKKVEVYLFDGPHSLEHQEKGLLLAIPCLADRAIVFIDDYNCENVPASIENILKMNVGYKRQIKFWTGNTVMFREGFVALEFEKQER